MIYTKNNLSFFHRVKFLTSFVLFLCLLLPVVSFSENTSLTQQEDVQEFIDLMVKNHGFEKQSLEKLFDQVEIQPAVLQSIQNPAEAKPWSFYHSFFLTDKRIEEGKQFWLANQDTLTKVEKEYGVPANIIVAILGVETFYGDNQGNYRVIDSLSTLAFDYPPRAQFFKNELIQYLLLTRENNIDPLSLKGSYAGAIGQPQFMPSSYRYYAIDYSHNNQIDLQNNVDDVIASIANYLKRNGWQEDQPITMAAQVSGDAYMKINTLDVKPRFSQEDLTSYGISPAEKLPDGLDSSFLVLNPEDSPEFHLAFNNFYTITRYNTSINYAMAVYLLGQAITAEMQNTNQEKAES